MEKSHCQRIIQVLSVCIPAFWIRVEHVGQRKGRRCHSSL